MNIAIIVGNHTYKSLLPLPACLYDCRAIFKIITASNKYQAILFLEDESRCEKAAREISSFLDRYKSEEIEELFFYYTGHGKYDGEQFFFLWNDYDENRKEKTSLANREVDRQLSEVHASLTVKVVDACQSGISYMGGDRCRIHNHTDNFNKCYFLFSSKTDQKSFVEPRFSYFTYSFIKSLEKEAVGRLHYKEIIDAVSNDFKDITIQSPYFVVQADFTEVFLTIDASLEKKINEVWGELVQGDPSLDITAYRLNGII